MIGCLVISSQQISQYITKDIFWYIMKLMSSVIYQSTKVGISVLLAFFFLLEYSSNVHAQTLPTNVLLNENFQTKEQLRDWDFFTPGGCSIDISGYENHIQYGTPFSPEGGNDLLISREAGNFECNASYFPKEEIKSNGYISLWFYDNNKATNNLNFLVAVKNAKGDAVSLAVRTKISADEYILRINSKDYRTNVKRTKGWQFFEFILNNGEIYTQLNDESLRGGYPYPANFNDISELKFAAGWGTKQAARIDGLLVKKDDIRVSSCKNTLCRLLDFPVFPIDTNAVYKENGVLKQIITSGNRYWRRPDIYSNKWYNGVLFDNEENKTNQPFPSSIDTNVIYPVNGKNIQVITKGDKWWYRGNTDGPWTSSGKIFSKGINNTGCPFPSKLDGNSIYSSIADPSTFSQISVSDNIYWFREDINGPWTRCGKLLPTINEAINTHTAFIYENDRYDIVTTNGKRWLLKNLQLSDSSDNNSVLWGENGELWNPRGRLPDFSYAGYHAGEKNIPFIPVKTNVKDFGAIGDGIHDDTKAFKDAIAATENGAVLVPKGRYKITDVLYIQKSNIVLRGQGSGDDGSVLVFPKSLTDMLGDKPFYKWGNGGVIWAGIRQRTGWTKDLMGSAVGTVVDEVTRGDKTIRISDTKSLKPGDYIMLSMEESADWSMETMLHNGKVNSNRCTWQPTRFLWVVQIDAINGQQVTLKQPLRVDVRQKWNPTIYMPQMYQEIGIEHLKIKFPDLPAPQHLKEKGYNGFEFRGVLNGWVNDVVIENADNGASVIASKHLSILNLTITNKNRAPIQFDYTSYFGKAYGHHGISFLVDSSDNLLLNYQITRFMHDITMQGLVNGNVIKNASGEDLALDHHGDIPYENLFTNLNMGKGLRTYSSSGDLCSGPHAGARETFWNLKYNDTGKKAGIPLSFDLFPEANVIGGNQSVSIIPRDIFIEKIDNLQPVDLYDSQFKARVKRENITLYSKEDINKDKVVNTADFNILTDLIFHRESSFQASDIVNDGAINLLDLVSMIN